VEGLVRQIGAMGEMREITTLSFLSSPPSPSCLPS
jgi:hypothetical protein